MSSSRAWRKIIRRDTKWKERLSMSGRSLSWSASYDHRLTLECGHIQVRGGFTDPPSKKTICKKCESGKPPVSIEGIEHGVFDHTRNKKPSGSVIVEAMAKGYQDRNAGE